MSSNIAGRLRASVRYGAIDGDRFERSVCAKQMVEAADEIDASRVQLSELLPIADAYQHMETRALRAEAQLASALETIEAVKAELAVVRSFARECDLDAADAALGRTLRKQKEGENG